MIEMPDGVRIEMYWRHLQYINGNNKLIFEIEPMMDRSCFVYFPTEEQWENIIDKVSFDERLEIIFLLERIRWKRKVIVVQSNIPIEVMPADKKIEIKGSLERTTAGRKIEESYLFDPNSPLNKEQVQKIYLKLEKRYVESLKGIVTIENRSFIKNSVFDEYTLPLLKNNKNIHLCYK